MAEERKKYEKVVQNEVKMAKKEELRKSIIANDAKTVGHYTLFDVFIPSVKRIIYDLTTKALGMSLFGNGGGPANQNQGYVSYARPYSQISYANNNVLRPVNPSQQQQRVQQPAINDYAHFVYATRGDAEYVLEQMQNILDDYSVVRVSELYDLAGKTAPITSENYGWTSLAQAHVDVCSEGFCIKLPAARPINN